MSIEWQKVHFCILMHILDPAMLIIFMDEQSYQPRTGAHNITPETSSTTNVKSLVLIYQIESPFLII